jgi:hypothetical protein
VRNYLSIRLNDEWNYADHRKAQIVDHIALSAKGKYATPQIITEYRFLLGKFQLDHVMGYENPRDAMDAIKHLPTNMNTAYRKIFYKIKLGKGKHIGLKILFWLFHAKRSLYITELQEVLSIRTRPPDTELFPDFFMRPDLLIHYCQGLVELDENSGIVRFTHYTVQEFLQQRVQSSLLSVLDIAEICLTYLTFNVFETPYPDESSLRRLLETHRFTNYAVGFWGSYTRGEAEKNPVIRSAIFKLLKCPKTLAAIRQIENLVHNPMRDPDTFLSEHELEGWTPLHVFASKGLATIFDECSSQALHGEGTGIGDEAQNIDIELGGINDVDVYYQSTPLHEAARHGHTIMLNALIRRGADCQAHDGGRKTALHWAARHGYLDTVVALLDFGADIMARTYSRWTPLHESTAYGHKDVLLTLLNNGADAMALDDDLNIILAVALAHGHDDVLLALLDAEIDVAWRGQFLLSLLGIRDTYGNEDLVRLCWKGFENLRQKVNSNLCHYMKLHCFRLQARGAHTRW